MATRRIAIFPLPGALLLPGLGLPLHIFEPRYRAMIHDVMARDRQIGMIQPLPGQLSGNPDHPPLFDVGCVGRVAEIEALDDGRFNIVLEGIARFRVVRELDVTTAFRQVEAAIEDNPPRLEFLSAIARAEVEREARRFADAQGYAVVWDSVARLDDQTLVNGIVQVAPFDGAAKQALLEADTLADRADMAVQLMQFFGRRDADDDRVTLQ